MKFSYETLCAVRTRVVAVALVASTNYPALVVSHLVALVASAGIRGGANAVNALVAANGLAGVITVHSQFVTVVTGAGLRSRAVLKSEQSFE